MIALFWENLRISLGSIFANKSRSILTALGIVIGVLSVTLMGTLISGLDHTFEKSMAFLGRDVLILSRMDWFSGDVDWWEMRNRPRMKEVYGEQLRRKSQFIEAVAPVSERGGSIVRGDRKSTRLNSSHALISYAVFCLKKKKQKKKPTNKTTQKTKKKKQRNSG